MSNTKKPLHLRKGQILLCESKTEKEKDWCIFEVARVGIQGFTPESMQEEHYVELLDQHTFFARNLASSGSDFLVSGDFEFMINKQLEEVEVSELDPYTTLMVAQVRGGVKNGTNWNAFLFERNVSEEEENDLPDDEPVSSDVIAIANDEDPA